MKKIGTIGIIIAVLIFGFIMMNNKNKLPETNSVVQNTNTSSQPVSTSGKGVTTNTPTTPTTSTTASVGTFTLAQVATHNTEADCYSAINGQVYDLTAWINKHPGGDRAILSICGKDGSAAFDGQHGGQKKPEQILAGFEVGTLAQ
jgi:cytochrome b involved in lipid metabolism